MLADLGFPLSNVREQPFSLDGFNDGDDSGRCDRTATECRAEAALTDSLRYALAAKQCATGDSTAEPFGCSAAAARTSSATALL